MSKNNIDSVLLTDREISEKNMLKLMSEVLKYVAPPEDITVSKWAEKYRVLDSLTSKFVGAWSNDMTPHLVEPMDAMSPTSGIRHCVLMFGSQNAKTEGIINAIDTFVDIDPCPMAYFLPTETQAQEYSKKRITPSFRNCKLSKLFPEKSRNGQNTTMSKIFPGGSLMMAGANSPVAMAGYPLRVIFRDEIDRWPLDVGGEGDGLSLTEQRVATFGDDAKIVDTGTPTLKGQSAIEKMFLLSDQRHWYVPCPHCGEFHELLFRRLLPGDEKETRMMHFETTAAGAVIKAYMVCPFCGGIIEEHHKPDMMRKGIYIKHNPGATIAGWFCNGLNSLLMSWKAVGERWFAAQKDYLKLKAFVNLILAETWEDPALYVSPNALQTRAEKYAKVPDQVLLLTCACDVQHDRLELEVAGWGRKNERWGIRYHVIYGSYEDKETWNQLEEFLLTPFDREDGRKQRIICTFVDSADGNSTQAVYDFCYRNKRNKVFAIHGKGGDNMSPIHAYKDDQKNHIRIVTLGSDTLKNISAYMLKLEDKGENYCHFPAGNGYDATYYDQLTSEEQVEQIDKRNYRRKMWRLKSGKSRNEAWDVFCYNRAALEWLRVDWDRVLSPVGIWSNVQVDTKKRKKSNGIEV